LAWRRGDQRFHVVRDERHADVLLAANLGMAVRSSDQLGLRAAVAALSELELVEATPWTGPAAELGELARLVRASAPPNGVAKPLWAHLQPFTRCNQRCVHCYCFGGPEGTGFELGESIWLLIIQQLANYGIRDIYITGGETLLYASVFRLADYILSLGLSCGLSTNAMAVTDVMAARLRELALTSIQVSIDGGTAKTNDRLRGMPGAFERTLQGLDRLAEITTPVINTVVTAENLHELDDIVALGRGRGCGSFKFFPEKIVGRSRGHRHGLDAGQIGRLFATCERLRVEQAVEIESLDNSPECGSADTGFAVDQAGDVYPCIFGIAEPAQRAGNILEDSIDHLWFDSPVLRRFREQTSRPCHRCETPCSS
jgi:radical SAM protein with 4Fe4S-binding SPASM domain